MTSHRPSAVPPGPALHRLRRHSPWIALAAGAALTGALGQAGLQAARRIQHAELQWQARAAATRIEAQLKAHQAAAQVLRGALPSGGPVDAAPAGAAAEAWRGAMPELRALAVLPADAAEAAAAPAARARDSGQPVASADGRGVHVWLPLYAGAAVPLEAGQRRSAYRGVLRYTLAAQALLPAPQAEHAGAVPRLRLLLHDGASPAGQPAAPAAVLADSAGDPAGVPTAPEHELRASAGFFHAAHTWTVEAAVPARMPASARLLLAAVAAAGLGSSIGLAWALHAAQRRRGAAQAVAAGMAHELNQPIAALLLSSFNVRAWLEQQRPDRATDALDRIEQAAQRMGRIVSQWPVLAREGRVHLRSVNLSDLLARAMQQAPATLVEPPDRQLHVLAVAAGLEQVVAGLLSRRGPPAAGAAPPAAEIRTAAGAEAVTIEILHPDGGPGSGDAARPFLSRQKSVTALSTANARRRLRSFGGNLHTRRDERGLAFVLTLRPGA